MEQLCVYFIFLSYSPHRLCSVRRRLKSKFRLVKVKDSLGHIQQLAMRNATFDEGKRPNTMKGSAHISLLGSFFLF